jgi:hypothetical protein
MVPFLPISELYSLVQVEKQRACQPRKLVPLRRRSSASQASPVVAVAGFMSEFG